MSVRSDAELARDWQAGDHTAFAEVYEKYSPSLFGVAMGLVRDQPAAADVVHDTFVRAARRISGLREPDRLRAWLFAILRNEGTDWHRARGRESAANVSAMSDHLAADLPEPHTELSRSELAEVVWTAAQALQQRDREVLELHLRAGLEAGDLADALGVTAGHAAVMLSRMRDRMEKAIGALLIARLGRRECGALDGLLARWDGRFTLEVRSRVTRHVESCPVCTRGRMQFASYQRLAPAVLPVFLVPELLRERVLTSYDLVSQQLAAAPWDSPGSEGTVVGPGGTGDGGPLDSWSWREDGFPEPRPAKPTGTVADIGDDPAGHGGRDDPQTGGTGPIAAAAGAGGTGPGPGPVAAVAAADVGVHPGLGYAPVPTPRRSPMLPLLAAGLVTLLVIGGIGVWKILGGAPDRTAVASSSSSPGVGVPAITGDALTIDPSATTSGSSSPTTSAPGTGTPSPSGTASTATTTGTATATGTTSGAATTPAAAAHLSIGAGSIAFGGGRSSSSTRRTVTLTDDGGQPLTWTATRTGAGYSVSPGSGTLNPGQSVTLTVVLNRANLAEGSARGTLDVGASPAGQSFHLPLTGSVNNPPAITLRSSSTTLAYSAAGTGCLAQVGGLSALVTDDSGVSSVVLSWSDGGSHSVSLSQDGAPWYGSYGPFSAVRNYTLTVTATDVNRNAGTLRFTVSVVSCA